MFNFRLTTRIAIATALFALSLVHTLCGSPNTQPVQVNQSEQLPRLACQAGEVVPDEVLVTFVPGTAQNEVEVTIEKAAEANRPVTFRQISSELNIYLVRGRGLTKDVFLQQLKVMNLENTVVAAEPNLVFCLESGSYDQWALRDYSPGMPGISAVSAWTLTQGSDKVVVGVIDTGMDITHPDLEKNLWQAPASFVFRYNGKPYKCRNGWNALDHNCNPDDSGWHGTHVAGIVGAKGGNGFGIDGVNWHVRLMPLKAFDIDGSGKYAAVIEAMDFVLQAKRQGVDIRVVNNSYGARCKENNSCSVLPAFEKTLELLNRAGVLFVASAGEKGPEHDNDRFPHYPSSFPHDNVISVAWTDKRDELTPDSNYGFTSVDLGAPGSAIWSTIPQRYTALQGYHIKGGSSMAAPFVSGAAALVLSVCPGVEVKDLKHILLSTVDLVDPLKGKTVTGGRLNVYKAVQKCRESIVR